MTDAKLKEFCLLWLKTVGNKRPVPEPMLKIKKWILRR